MRNNIYFNEIINRAKKMSLIFIIIPILLGMVLVFSSKEEKQNYIGQSEVMTGNFDDSRYSNTVFLLKYLKSSAYLNEIVERYHVNVTVEKIKQSLQIASPDQKNEITFTYTSVNKGEVEEVLGAILEDITKLSDNTISAKNKEIDTTIESLLSIKNNPEPATTIQLISELEKSKKSFVGNTILEDISISVSKTFSSTQLLIMGIIIGFIIDLLILLVPVIFRNDN